MWKEETMNYLKIRAVFEIFKLVFTDKKIQIYKYTKYSFQMMIDFISHLNLK